MTPKPMFFLPHLLQLHLELTLQGTHLLHRKRLPEPAAAEQCHPEGTIIPKVSETPRSKSCVVGVVPRGTEKAGAEWRLTQEASPTLS